METMISIGSKEAVEKLSEQECVSCAYGSDGCNSEAKGEYRGYEPTQCLNYAKVNKISPAEVYPYTATPENCQENLAKRGKYVIGQITSLDQDPSSSADTIISALNLGPVLSKVDASNVLF